MVDLTAADDEVSIDVKGACEAVDHLPTNQEGAVDGEDLPLDECLRDTETEMLCFAVDRARRQLAGKIGGLDADQLRRRHSPVDHDTGRSDQAPGLRRRRLARAAADRPVGPPWDARSWEDNDTWIWSSADTDAPDEQYAWWYDGARRARDDWAELSAHDGLDVTVERGGRLGDHRRRWVIDLLEEYLKHTGNDPD